MKNANLNSNSGSSVTKKSSKAGFFQISLERIDQAVAAGATANEVMAYLVLAGGTQGGSAQPRTSTHSTRSVRKRCAIPTPDQAIDWLEGKGFIIKAHDDGRHGAHAGAATWQVDPEAKCDLSICQALFGEGSEFATLKSLQEQIRPLSNAPRRLAMLDALMVFLHLQKRQNFGAFAGVDPAAAHANCTFIDPDEDGDLTDDFVRFPCIQGKVLVTHRAFEEVTLSSEFAKSALGNIPVQAGWPDLRTRADHALVELMRLRFVYRTLIAWDGDPLGGSRFAEPQATLYVHDSWARKVDSQTQNAVHGALLCTGARTGSDFFTPDEGRPQFLGSNIFRNLVDESVLNRYTLLSQLRVRHWPADKQTVEGRLDVANRDAAIQAQLRGLISASKEAMLATD